MWLQRPSHNQQLMHPLHIQDNTRKWREKIIYYKKNRKSPARSIARHACVQHDRRDSTNVVDLERLQLPPLTLTPHTPLNPLPRPLGNTQNNLYHITYTRKIKPYSIELRFIPKSNIVRFSNRKNVCRKSECTPTDSQVTDSVLSCWYLNLNFKPMRYDSFLTIHCRMTEKRFQMCATNTNVRIRLRYNCYEAWNTMTLMTINLKVIFVYRRRVFPMYCLLSMVHIS